MRGVAPWLLIALILGCGLWLWQWSRAQPEPGEPEPHLIPGICTSCGKVFQETVTWVPSKCRFCGKKTLYEAKKCVKCGAIGAMIKTDRDATVEFKCGKCGGAVFTEAPPDAVPRP